LKKQQRARMQRVITLHQFMNIVVSLLVEPTRLHILKALSPGDDIRALSARMTWWTAIAGAMEFLLNPTLGKLSDAVGRKPFFMLSPLASVALKALFVLRPSPLTLGLEAVVCDGLRVISGSTICSAALTDLLSGQELSAAFSTQLAVSGLSVVVGPLVASAVISRTGSMYAPFAVAAVAAGGMLLADCLLLEETLEEDARKEFGGFVNPLSLVRVFASRDARFNLLVCVAALNNAVEPKNTSVLAKVNQLDSFKMSATEMSLMTSLSGVSMYAQKPVQVALSRLGAGPPRVRSLANLATFLGFAIRALPRRWALYASMLLGSVGLARAQYSSSLRVARAVELGWGRGEFTGQMANLRAVLGVVAPVLYSGCFAALARRGAPSGYAFLAPASVGLATEALCQAHLALSPP